MLPSIQSEKFGLLSRDQLRDLILSGVCPFCGREYMAVSIHISKSHDVSAEELKEMAGIPKTRPACHPAHSEMMRKSQLDGWTPSRTERMREAQAKGLSVPRVFSTAGSETRKATLTRYVRRHVDSLASRDAEIAQRALAGESIEAIATSFGVGPRTASAAVRRAGIQADFRKQAAARRGPAGALRATAARVAALAEERDDRLLRFAQLGGDWQAALTLASEVGISTKAMVGFLRRHGVDVPDGRTASPLAAKVRSRPRPKTPPKPCNQPMCDAPAKCRGMCSKHYQRWNTQQHRHAARETNP